MPWKWPWPLLPVIVTSPVTSRVFFFFFTCENIFLCENKDEWKLVWDVSFDWRSGIKPATWAEEEARPAAVETLERRRRGSIGNSLLISYPQLKEQFIKVKFEVTQPSPITESSVKLSAINKSDQTGNHSSFNTFNIKTDSSGKMASPLHSDRHDDGNSSSSTRKVVYSPMLRVKGQQFILRSVLFITSSSGPPSSRPLHLDKEDEVLSCWLMDWMTRSPSPKHKQFRYYGFI